MNIIGISRRDRDTSAALIRDGAVIAAIEEEKLQRAPNGGVPHSGLPYRAIEFCLKRGNIDIHDVDYIAYYLQPYKTFLRSIRLGNVATLGRPGIGEALDLASYAVADLRRHLKTRREIESLLSQRARFVAINHHFCHAAGAFYLSGFDESAVVVAGNVGDLTSMSLLTGRGTRLAVQAQARFPDSLGMVYTAVTAALGFGAGHENRTMWLACTGENEFRELFEDMLRIDRNGLPIINRSYFKNLSTGAPALSERFFRRTGLSAGAKESEVTTTHRNVAASLQSRMEAAMCDIVARHRERTRQENLCLAGGVALNSMINAIVEKDCGFKNVFVEPVPGNAGASLGAALYLWHGVLGGDRHLSQSACLFLGPSYDDQSIKTVLDNCKVNYKYFLTEDRQIAEVAQLLSRGVIVAWFQGATEFGPRALGARCILASPATEIMRDNLNRYIKHREDFRPFCAAVPQEFAADFFEPSGLTSLIQGVCKVREDRKWKIPAVVFSGGVARVHTVNRNDNPGFWKLIMKFGGITGTPVLLSTSFNLFGEPLVSSPREAVRGFYSSGVDCLVIGRFLVKKQDHTAYAALGSAFAGAANCVPEIT